MAISTLRLLCFLKGDSSRDFKNRAEYFVEREEAKMNTSKEGLRGWRNAGLFDSMSQNAHNREGRKR